MTIPVFFIRLEVLKIHSLHVQTLSQTPIFASVISSLHTSVAFTGHRTYGGQAAEALCAVVRRLHARGCRTFLCGMAVGFDLAAAEAVVACRQELPDIALVAVIPFEGQERGFSAADRERYARVRAAADSEVVLLPAYRPGCYALRNDYLVDRASVVVAWYDGSPGGTRYTVRRALRRGREVVGLCPRSPLPASAPTLF